MTLPYSLAPPDPAPLGLIVLQSDETIEMEFRQLLGPDQPLFVSRIPSDTEVTSQTLAAMRGRITDVARLFPEGRRLAAVGYGCTSASAEIGPGPVARLIKAGCDCGATTEPLSALIAACEALGVRRIGFVSPYVPPVSARLREAIGAGGVTVARFDSFDEPLEANVVRIEAGALREAAHRIAAGGGIDAVFLSCTNLRTFRFLAGLEAELGLPFLSSNLVLGWHMLRLAGLNMPDRPERLWTA